MHAKKDYLERFVFPLSPWKIEEEVTLPADAQPKQDCTVTIGGHEVVITVPKDKEGGSVIKQPVLLRRLQMIARAKNQMVLLDMCLFRDELMRDPDGVAVIERKSSGLKNAEQMEIKNAAESIPPKVLESEKRRDAFDREVLSRSLILHAESIIEPFEEKLRALFPDAKKLSSTADLGNFAKEDMLIAIAPVKNLPRAQVTSR